MTSVGCILRNAREGQGLTIAHVAQELRLTQGYVCAIEDGDLKTLPGLFFYKSFVRQYATLVGIDLERIRPQLAALSSAEESSARPDIRMLDPLVEQTNRRFIPDIPLGWSVAGLAAVLLVCSGFYTWWTRMPERSAAPPSAQAANPPVPTRAAVATQPVVHAEPDGLSGVVLKLSATERTWLSVSSGGREIFSGILQPSESKTLTGLDMGTMRVGNAGGINVHWNGKPMGPLGTRGQVLTIRFTLQDFEIVPPKEQL
jgi:cytoskeletal protein RodZ